MTTERFLYINEGPNLKNLQQFVSDSIEHLIEKNYKKIAIYSSTKDSFFHGITSNVFPPEFIQSLKKTGSHTLEDTTFYLVTPRNINSLPTPDMIIAIYISAKDLDKADDLRTCKSISYISWLTADAHKWASTWNPHIWGGTVNATTNILPEIVINEFQRLTKMINLSSGLTHPTDKQIAINIFKSLKLKKITILEGEAKSWAMRNGWESKHADELEKLSKRYIQ